MYSDTQLKQKHKSFEVFELCRSSHKMLHTFANTLGHFVANIFNELIIELYARHARNALALTQNYMLPPQQHIVTHIL